MKVSVEHEKYGAIVYEETFWLGKKSLSINGVALTATGKKTFAYKPAESDTETVMTVKGSFITGVQLQTDTETVQLTPKPLFFEWFIPLFTFIFLVVWGNVPACVKIIPTVGGAIGGGISALVLLSGLYISVSTEKKSEKLLFTIGAAIVTFVACTAVGYLIVSMMN